MSQAVPIATSIVTIIGMWAAGSGKWWAWALGLANQGLWLVLIIQTETWGLLLLTAALIVTYTRNLVRWRRLAGATEVAVCGLPASHTGPCERLGEAHDG